MTTEGQQIDPLVAEQLELEEEGQAAGEQRYYKQLQSHVEHGNEDLTVPVRQAIQRVIAEVTEGIRLRLDKIRNHPSKPAKWMNGLVHIVDTGLKPQSIAYLTLRHAMSHVSCQNQRLSTVAVRIGTAICDEHLMMVWQEQDPDGYKITQEQIKKHTHRRKSRGVIRRMQKLSGLDTATWDEPTKAAVGMAMIDILVSVTGWWRTGERKVSRNRKLRTWEPTPQLSDWLEQAHSRLAAMQPIQLPMVVEPDPWSTPWDGGYLSIPETLVKTRDRDYLRELAETDMPNVYDALNYIQSTPWAINESVLNVAQELWQNRQPVGSSGDESLPPVDAKEIPAIPAQYEGQIGKWKEEDFDGYKVWAQRAAALHEENQRNASKRITTAETIGIAARFAKYKRIFFPHQLDFRGRAYPMPIHLHPQGNDLARGLLVFADAKPLGSSGAYWLKVHAANQWGEDKCSFDDRVKWVEAHQEEITACAIDPMENQWWTEADAPFQFLAACFELAGYWVEGDSYQSRLPVAMDGSCNGLQNFSALLRDEVGGKATNLVPADSPADIYSEVAAVAARRVREDAEAGHPAALAFDGLVNRSLVKQPVMTLPYGATKLGMRKMIESAIRKAGNPTGIQVRDMWKYCGYMADATFDAISEVVIAARNAMDWLQESARKCSAEDRAIRWTTPLGMPIKQEYKSIKSKDVRAHIAGKSVAVLVGEEIPKLAKRKQSNGIAPNFVHSLDAAHMMRTALYCAHEGVTHLAMVHDSFGSHAADVDVLHAAIRTAFVDQYEPQVLAEFRDEIAEQMDDPSVLPELPPEGNLDVEQVLDADYFFA